MQFTRSQIEAILTRVVIVKGRREGCTLGPAAIKQYLSAIMSVYKEIGDDAFVPELLEEYLDNSDKNTRTKRTVTITAKHITNQAACFSDEIKDEMQALSLRMCDGCNDRSIYRIRGIRKCRYS